MEPCYGGDTWIEEQRPGYVRYRRVDGRRWEVHGTCDRRGDCLVGAVLDDGSLVTREMVDAMRGTSERLISDLDVPVTPEFDTCCGTDLFTYVELEA